MSFEAHGAIQGAPEAQPVTSTPTQAPKVETQAPAPVTEAPKPESAPQTAAQAPAVPEWTPNFKFKVMDKEHEIPEFLRGAIKDAETEKQLRELHEKAYGLDFVKPRFHETREELKSLRETHNGVMQSIQELRESYSIGDFDSFFKKLNIPQEKILQWVIDKAQYNELPPEQRHALDARKTAEQQALELRKQNQTLEQQYEEAMLQARSNQLQVALAKPDVKQFAENFDSIGFKNAKGQQISFMDAVIETGEYAWYASKGKVDLSPEQAIQEVMARYSPVMTGRAPAAPPVIPVQGTQSTVSQPPKKPASLPNVAGRQSSSVAKSKPRSLEDLKKLAAQG